MSRRAPNPGLIKLNQTYEVHELALRVGVHRNTVRGWVKKGLKPIDDRRPFLFHGSDIREFLKNQRKPRYRKCEIHELFCLVCKAPKLPQGNIVDYLPIITSAGNLCGRCPDCGHRIFKRISKSRLPELFAKLQVHDPQQALDIGDIPNPCVNCDSGDPGDPHD